MYLVVRQETKNGISGQTNVTPSEDKTGDDEPLLYPSKQVVSWNICESNFHQ